MKNDEAVSLARAVEGLHECRAKFKDRAYIVENFKGQKVWQGYVYRFDLIDHPTAKLCYAWSAPIEGSDKRKFYAVLHTPPVESPEDAVRAAIATDYKGGGGNA